MLGKTLQEVQEGTTSSEFVEWVRFMELDWTETKKEDYYRAQIAAEVARSHAKNPRNVKVTDFLIRFRGHWDRPRGPTSKSTAERSKKFWFSALGMKGA